ncbi:acyl carrier protein [uncultured Treponema sp.]|uniref:acyl carrier protein n=1 Tax=uncultured Treponema sp. TaxID=162155 RepID=UPI0026303CF9|nr:acyl carrier protein [uncultured Treponema sp.]
MEEKVLEILKSVLEDDSVNTETSQENNSNWDSLRQLNLVVELESEFGVAFEPDEMSSMTSVSKIIELLNSKTTIKCIKGAQIS